MLGLGLIVEDTWPELHLPKTIKNGVEGRQQPGVNKQKKVAPFKNEKKLARRDDVIERPKKRKTDKSIPKVGLEEKVEEPAAILKQIKITPLLESDFYPHNPLPVQIIVHAIQSCQRHC
mmetsp:Transcript_14825/g.20688  ORF Transcript_14825/g.20688 Transcript_14825/m.20688 type:complete len:119 (+) Transcript_14825:507-863(+)